MKWISMWFLLSGLATANAASIAVIDSGLDYKHEQIASNLWVNADEIEDRRDNDGNGYQDDVHGWNFAEQNGRIIDYKYLGTFSPDCKKYFDIQGKLFLGTATESERQWVREKVADAKFIQELSKFGNFVHGTHVAGITVAGSVNKAMGVKLIPTEVTPFFQGLRNKSAAVDSWALLERALDALAGEQMKLLTDIGRFVHSHKVEVANGSFGTGFNQAKVITDVAFRVLFLRKPTAEESTRAARLFIGALLKSGQGFVAAAPNTLFVFAAGNDGLSNDDFGTSPANIRADNVITVGATYENRFFAPFSNFGTRTVDVAAPGMLVTSAIPGNDTLAVSGTSQAAPFVANIAAQIKDANPKLTPKEIKAILLGTVDVKAFLKEKVSTGGIVNSERAVVAAQISRSEGIAVAIAKARVQVRDVETSATSEANPGGVTPLPLYPMFRF
jgi:cell wall-associated protease